MFKKILILCILFSMPVINVRAMNMNSVSYYSAIKAETRLLYSNNTGNTDKSENKELDNTIEDIKKNPVFNVILSVFNILKNFVIATLQLFHKLFSCIFAK